MDREVGRVTYSNRILSSKAAVSSSKYGVLANYVMNGIMFCSVRASYRDLKILNEDIKNAKLPFEVIEEVKLHNDVEGGIPVGRGHLILRYTKQKTLRDFLGARIDYVLNTDVTSGIFNQETFTISSYGTRWNRLKFPRIAPIVNPEDPNRIFLESVEIWHRVREALMLIASTIEFEGGLE